MGDNGQALEELIAIMDRLLGEGGCPWDQEQTHESLIRYLIEECYEVIEAINQQDMDELAIELGDLLLQVVFHAALAERAGAFDFADVARAVSKKMVDRHPHVFGNMDLKTADDVLNKWEGFKKKEGKKYLLEGIPNSLPALMRAEKMQEKAARVGFDWPDAVQAAAKFKEEVDELVAAQSAQEIREEMGDVLFALVNVARLQGIEPEQALQAANDKFERRFHYIEKKIEAAGERMEDYNLAQLDQIWDEAKTKGL
ncbi:NTP pyrophosphohydrolase MazG, bacterial [Syntrophomonas zehnderi OL-4]|uniref:NTP pyrophosphohydrolase MazG, bacterial n=1 Tax=Syntrophomonas zehnderi OL-4 TaxID=690567 RepID=A0A0E3W2N0_9FIRM|nr:nucleoside triphosphate pyrophosphohydrolase [Syntrophomonas zehnderi]CFX10449.1 NTP pyrophosphohydrolase MazG, bacterial [Syntrophomonas zehnderi OL-4]